MIQIKDIFGRLPDYPVCPNICSAWEMSYDLSFNTVATPIHTLAFVRKEILSF